MRLQRQRMGFGARLTPHGVSGLKLPSRVPRTGRCCLTPHGVSGLKLRRAVEVESWRIGLTPHGVSGLKWRQKRALHHIDVSHPTRGEWIEISGARLYRRADRRLTPHGVSGLK